MGLILRAVFICMAPVSVQASPVSYPGGSTLMAFSDNAKNALYYHYSPTRKYSLGIEILKDRYREEDYSYLRFTYLLNRKNTEKSRLLDRSRRIAYMRVRRRRGKVLGL